MNVQPVQRIYAPVPVAKNDQRICSELVTQGLLTSEEGVKACHLAAHQNIPLQQILIFHDFISEAVLLSAMAAVYGLPFFDADECIAEISLIDRIGPRRCLELGILPVKPPGQGVFVAISDPQNFDKIATSLKAEIGPVNFVLAPAAVITNAVLTSHRKALAQEALTRVSGQESCRTLIGYDPTQVMSLGLIFALSTMTMAPTLMFVFLFFAATLMLILNTGFKIMASLASFSNRPETTSQAPQIANGPLRKTLPRLSLLVPLHKEDQMVPLLLQRLDRLDYPRPLLDILLIVEEDDTDTLDAIKTIALPRHVDIVQVPQGKIMTKPRALNYALSLAKGEIIGIYDAEDAPEPDQIRKAVAAFHDAGPDLACVQAALDYYNTRTNWLSRCFTMEYATWFRVLLPGLQRLRIPIPLGGTSVFIRRDILEKVGAWDAYNVTEDADLGMRLARHGYRTEIIDSVTFEEANCRPWPWIKQRSRWLKGYALTYWVQMRRPVQLWRALGPRGFLGLQMLFLGTLLGFTLAPVLLSFWLVTMGVPHPASETLAPLFLSGFLYLFIFGEAVTILISILAVYRAKRRYLVWWVPSLHFYFPLASIAAFKAAYECLTTPFSWEKTAHGHSLQTKKRPLTPPR